MLDALILYNEPVLDESDPDRASEAGVLDSVQAFADAIARAGGRAEAFGLGIDVRSLFERCTSSARPRLVVNFCEGFAGDPAGEVYVAGLLELLGISYTGSGPEALALARDKRRVKLLLQGAGVPTADFVYIGVDDAIPYRRLDGAGPLFVKPAAEDASLGVDSASVVSTADELQRKVEQVRARYGPVLVERYLAGREFNVGVIAVPEPRVLPLAEIAFGSDPGNPWRIVTYEAKWSDESLACVQTPPVCPADVEEPLASRIREVALEAFTLVGCRDYARVDVRLSDSGEPCVLEVNANPDLAPTAGLARAIRAGGMSYDAFVAALTDVAAQRPSR